MEYPHPMYPQARQSGLLIDQAGDETIVYDEERKEAHSLNRTASVVWRYADGAHSVPQLASLVGQELGIAPDTSLVEYALDELSRVHLIENGTKADDHSLSRRAAVRRMTFAGVSAIAIPAVLSIVAPTPAMAASGSQNGQGQNNNKQGPNQP